MNGLSQYERQVGVVENDSLTKVVRLIPPGAKVLDLGTGPGALGEYLKRFKDCRCDGFDSAREFADRARPYYDRFFLCDIEAVDLGALVGGARYDRIVCADVLEHLREPEAVLRQLPALLATGGRIIISIPNVAYAGLVAELAAGRFQYRDNGLLDRTHLRFFTRESLGALVAGAGLTVVSEDAVTCPIGDSEFDLAAGACGIDMEALVQLPHALTYQFILETAVAADAPYAGR